MSLETAEARIKAEVWQAIAEHKVIADDIPREQLSTLVDLMTEAALKAMDRDLIESTEQAAPAVVIGDPFDDVEEILWKGRPFLSITVWYTITDERIRVTRGLLGKEHIDIELVRIQSMDQKQTFGERLLKLGDITIRSHDPENPLIILNNVSNPQDVHETLRRAVLKARRRHNLSYREEM